MVHKNNILLAFLLCILCLGSIVYAEAQVPPSVLKQIKAHIERSEAAKEQGNIPLAASEIYRAGMLYFNSSAFEQAVFYLEKAKDYYIQLESFENAQRIYSNIALAHANNGNYSRAMLFVENGLKIRAQYGTQIDYVGGLLDLAHILAMQKNYNLAITKVQEALSLIDKTKYPQLTLVCYSRLESYYRNQGNTGQANNYAERYTNFNTQYQASLKDNQEREMESQKREAEARAAEERLKYEMELRLADQERLFAEDSLGMIVRIKQDSIERAALLAKQNQTQIRLLEQEAEIQQSRLAREEAESKHQRRIISAISIGMVVLIIIGFFLTISRRKIKKQAAELAKAFALIEEQNKDISDSIHYAREIQKAFLPKQTDLGLLFDNSFIFFEPRDLVSGDYYWFTKTQFTDETGEKIDKYLVAAIDCTGHGVPGALLSMTGFTILENIVNDKKVHRPGMILDILHTEIRKKLRQNETPNRDGMDMALIAYTPKTKELQFAGAKNPLVLIKNNQVERIKGSLKPIGGEIFEPTEKMKFKQKNIVIDEPYTAYLFSDGFSDQIGGEQGRKYMNDRFRNLLLSIHQKDFKEQQELLDREFAQWKGKQPQIDDVLIIGFKLNP